MEFRDGELMAMAGDGSAWARGELNRRARTRRGLMQRTRYSLGNTRGDRLDWRDGPPLRGEDRI